MEQTKPDWVVYIGSALMLGATLYFIWWVHYTITHVEIEARCRKVYELTTGQSCPGFTSNDKRMCCEL